MFISKGTIVPPEVTTTTGPRCFSQRLAMPFLMFSMSEMSVIACTVGSIESVCISTVVPATSGCGCSTQYKVGGGDL